MRAVPLSPCSSADSSGEPARITSKGIGQLIAYGIKKVFGLRAEVEIRKYNSGMPNIEDAEFGVIPQRVGRDLCDGVVADVEFLEVRQLVQPRDGG